MSPAELFTRQCENTTTVQHVASQTSSTPYVFSLDRFRRVSLQAAPSRLAWDAYAYIARDRKYDAALLGISTIYLVPILGSPFRLSATP